MCKYSSPKINSFAMSIRILVSPIERIVNTIKNLYEKINCLISGVTGMVGSHLVDFLIENTNGIFMVFAVGEAQLKI